ncbi:uncharacterized protein BT62DRAFT_554432 [Guyanagaster necrorhizus]|uniref:Uncharacterized protein n=1 Tax=Guyanagaster necrorhizus TaxID=856835 RepID=A0A9P7VI50_9AGAR|nr:uncharacterized protein BT62DRAFT_554432 [Guyanagaster necrorhizus MCA 3950]KAG7441008.1 hypothetical protein BT62DRAFT_554432 [Guyanagaster necrorhizus MCA 3950]
MIHHHSAHFILSPPTPPHLEPIHDSAFNGSMGMDRDLVFRGAILSARPAQELKSAIHICIFNWSSRASVDIMHKSFKDGGLCKWTFIPSSEYSSHTRSVSPRAVFPSVICSMLKPGIDIPPPPLPPRFDERLQNGRRGFDFCLGLCCTCCRSAMGIRTMAISTAAGFT